MTDAAGAPSAPALEGASGASFSGSSVDPRLIDLGLLLGILQSATSSPSDQQTVNIAWFANVLANLGQIPQRAVPLLDLLRRLLGDLGQPEPIDPPGAATSPARDWYPILHEGADTSFYIVLPHATAAQSNRISLGFSKTFTEGPFSAHVYGVIPVFAVPASPASVFVLGQAASPVELHLDVTQGPSSDVNGLRLTGRLSFQAKPTFALQLLAGSTVTTTYATVSALLSGSVTPLLDQILATAACQDFLNQKLGSTSATPGTILGTSGLGFLATSGGAYRMADLAPFAGAATAQWAMQVIKTILGAVASTQSPLVPIGTAPAGAPAPGLYVRAESDGAGGTDYGIRIVLPPLTLAGGSMGTDPTLTLAIGGWLAGETTTPDDTTWWSRAAVGDGVPAEPAPGITLFLVNAAKSGALSFTGRLELASIGVDYEPPAQQSLVELGGFTLGGVQARGYVNLDLTKPNGVVSTYGGALLCQNIGLPLGPSFGAGDGVVQSILAAGGSGDPQASQPVNPAFSISAAFVSGSKKPFAVELYDAAGNAGGTIWLPLQRTFGPLHLDRMGPAWQDAAGSAPALLSLHLDGGIALGPLSVDLIDLAIQMPPAHPLEPSGYGMSLDGMNISFANDPIALDGGLVASGGEYVGQASLNISKFGLGAIGAFGTVGGEPSLFVFGWTNEPVGGPPYFYVVGLAAGFGYNRALNLPAVQDVQQFPFIAALSQSDPFGGGGAPPSQQTQLAEAKNALTSLIEGNYVPATRGSYWLAVGVQFTSFQLVRSSALLAVEFGPDLTIAVLGLSKMQLGSNSSPYVYVELQLVASLKPNDGVLLVLAELSENSYVIDPDCHLTGGFAFGLWFGGPHEGDFVITAGGYHPRFVPPSHYPTVPRLGFNWSVSSSVTIQGDAYFAITPGCVMAGGGLQAAYHSGNLRAWVEAQADLLVQWRPFHFEAGIHVSVGVSYKVNLLFVSTTLTAQLGAGLDLWGPPTGGSIEVDWYIISFSIPFGAGRAPKDPVVWGDFVNNLIPNQPVSAARGLAAGASPTLQPRIDVQLTGGKVREDPAAGWIVRSDGLSFTVRSSVPANQVSFSGPSSSALHAAAYTVGIVPLGLASVSSGLVITLAPVSGGTGRFRGTFTPVVSAQNMPLAMWGTAAASQPSSAMTPLPVGLNLSADPYPAVGVPPIAITTLEYDTIDPPSGGTAPPAPMPLSPTAAVLPASGAESDGSLALIAATVTSSGAAAARAAILGAVADFGYGTGFTGAPVQLAQNLAVNLRAPTMVGTPAGVAWPPTSVR